MVGGVTHVTKIAADTVGCEEDRNGHVQVLAGSGWGLAVSGGAGTPGPALNRWQPRGSRRSPTYSPRSARMSENTLVSRLCPGDVDGVLVAAAAEGDVGHGARDVVLAGV